MGNKVSFMECTSSYFNTIEKCANTIYFLTDTQQIYKGNVLMSAIVNLEEYATKEYVNNLFNQVNKLFVE